MEKKGPADWLLHDVHTAMRDLEGEIDRGEADARQAERATTEERAKSGWDS